MTNVPASLKGIGGVVITTQFAEVRSGLPIIVRVHAVTALTPGIDGVVESRVEDQEALDVVFFKQLPDSIAAPRRVPPH